MQGASIILQALPYIMKFLFECSFTIFSNRDSCSSTCFTMGKVKKLALNIMKVISGYPLFQHPQTRGEWIYYIQVDSNYTAIFSTMYVQVTVLNVNLWATILFDSKSGQNYFWYLSILDNKLFWFWLAFIYLLIISEKNINFDFKVIYLFGSK